MHGHRASASSSSTPRHPASILLLLCFLCATQTAAPAAAAARSGEEPTTSTALIGLLLRVQSTALRALGPDGFDPKRYVDLPLSTDARAAAAALPSPDKPPPSRAEMERYLARYFGAAGSDLVPAAAELEDFEAEPRGFLPRVRSRAARAWALEVHALWRRLARRVARGVAERPERHTLLPLPRGVVVPGARFREVYYWDSYWIVRRRQFCNVDEEMRKRKHVVSLILPCGFVVPGSKFREVYYWDPYWIVTRGLLVSKMYYSAKDTVLNLVHLVQKYGFVPNGARSYYINRSQPPLLSSMVLEVYEATGDVKSVREAFPSLLKEHSFWTSEIHSVAIRDNRGHVHNLSRYQANWNRPRPESATIDEELASKINSTADKGKLYHQIASAAESGWDFSSRWMRNSTDMTMLATTYIVPVDLNTFIFKMERDIASFAKLIGDNATSEKFLEASKARHIAIDSILWNSEMEQWLDYWLPTDGDCQQGVYQWKSDSQNRDTFASNFIPLWLNAHHSGSVQFADTAKSERVMASLQKSGLLRAAGIATSPTRTGQQWDFPNGWPPLQHLIAEGLLHSGSKEAARLAEDIATRWVRTNYGAYKATGKMHEKYDVEACGKSGGGGEYKPQTGFGWTNGVVLSFLEEFGWPEHKGIDCSRRGEVGLTG